MKEKLIGWMNSRNYNSHLMRLLVGGYVAYLGVKILLGQPSLPQIILAVVMALPGALVALISLYAVFNGYSQEYKGRTSSDDKEESE